jgi:hypothetical protein
VFPGGVFPEESLMGLLENEKREIWEQLLSSQVMDLYKVQAQAQVVERMMGAARDRIAASTRQNKRTA